MMIEKLSLIVFCLYATISYSQVVVDKSINEAYFANTAEKCHMTYAIEVLGSVGILSQYAGEVIISIDHTDTLNKKDIIKHGWVKITDIDSSGKEIKSNITNQSNFEAGICTGDLRNTGLVIEMPIISFGGDGAEFSLIVAKGKAKGYYEECRTRDTILRLSLSQQKTNRLTIPGKFREFKLSSLDIEADKAIYGEVEFVSYPYYVDDSGFKSGYMIKRVHFKYLFALRTNEKYEK